MMDSSGTYVSVLNTPFSLLICVCTRLAVCGGGSSGAHTPQKSAVQIVMPAIVRGHYVRAVFGRPCGGGLGDVDVHV